MSYDERDAAMAEIVVKYAVGQTGFDRYRELLSRMFEELASLDLAQVARPGVKISLIDECREIQKLRNDVIHKGQICTSDHAKHAIEVAVVVYNDIVAPILASLGLTVVEKGRIEPSGTS